MPGHLFFVCDGPQSLPTSDGGCTVAKRDGRLTFESHHIDTSPWTGRKRHTLCEFTSRTTQRSERSCRGLPARAILVLSATCSVARGCCSERRAVCGTRRIFRKCARSNVCGNASAQFEGSYSQRRLHNKSCAAFGDTAEYPGTSRLLSIPSARFCDQIFHCGSRCAEAAAESNQACAELGEPFRLRQTRPSHSPCRCEDGNSSDKCAVAVFTGHGRSLGAQVSTGGN